MRAVIQRVGAARVTVGDDVVGEIGRGLLVFVGVGEEDSEADADALAAKIAGMRIFPDEAGLMNRSVSDVGGGVLVVSQFTLYGDVRRGRRPSFTGAAPPRRAAPLVDAVVSRLAAAGIDVATGAFGAVMDVALVNEGPVTLLVETREGRVV